MPRIKPHLLSLKLVPTSGTPGSGPGPPPTQLCKPPCLSPAICIPSPLLTIPINHCPSGPPSDVSQVHSFPSVSTSTAIVQATSNLTWGTETASLPMYLPPVRPLPLIHWRHHCTSDLVTPLLLKVQLGLPWWCSG